MPAISTDDRGPALALGSARPGWPVRCLDIATVFLAALAVRLIFFNGAFGSDDGTYYVRALDVAQGAWSSADYNGALRYGFNIPAGALAWLFGPSVAAVNAWPLLCSLVEIVTVYLVADALMGRRGALVAAVLIALAPLHVAVATRIHADPVVAAFLTLGFATLFFALRRGGDRRMLFVAGLLIGCVYWTKELAAVTFFALLPLLWYFRRRPVGALAVIAGTATMVGLNCLLMWLLADDPFHVIRVVLGALSRNFIQGGDGEDAPGYYLAFLLWDLRHVALLGPLACVALVLLATRARPSGDVTSSPGWGFVVAWLVGLLVVLSVFPVSLSPLRFTLKQSNYISLFLAPLSIVAAYAVSRLPVRAGQAVLVAAGILGLLLAALQQADYRAFTANSRALAAFGHGRPGALIVGTTNNIRLGAMLAAVEGREAPLLSYRAAGEYAVGYRTRSATAAEVLAVVDPQTAQWVAGRWAVTRPLPCWRRLAELQPTGLGFGNRVAGALAWLARAAGGAAAERVGPAFERLARPAPAVVYSVPDGDLWCERP